MLKLGIIELQRNLIIQTVCINFIDSNFVNDLLLVYRYAMMMRCWEEDPELRPGFSELVQSIGKDLQGMTDYIYTSAFNNQY